MQTSTILASVFLVILLIIIIKIMFGPLKIIMKLAFSCIIGTGIMYCINLVGGFIGIHIGLNALTVLISGVFGIPGISLILLLQLVFK